LISFFAGVISLPLLGGPGRLFGHSAWMAVHFACHALQASRPVAGATLKQSCAKHASPAYSMLAFSTVTKLKYGEREREREF